MFLPPTKIIMSFSVANLERDMFLLETALQMEFVYSKLCSELLSFRKPFISVIKFNYKIKAKKIKKRPKSIFRDVR